MKSLAFWLISLMVITTLTSCGKKNQSGKSGVGWDYLNPYGVNPITGQIGVNNPIVGSILSVYQCQGGWSGMPLPPGYPQQPYNNQRIPIQVPLTGSPFVVSPGDFHIGVTSYGDVAIVTGTAPGQPPVFTGYMCPRSFTQSGSGQLFDVSLGNASQRCPSVKPIVRATVVFPGGAVASFRAMDFGMYTTGQPFPGCY